jgi:hypothetical protein
MVTAIVTYSSAETHIRRYDTDDPHAAMQLFIHDWIAGRVVWEWWEFSGPHCTTEVPAFTPDFLREHCLNDCYNERITEGVHIWDWYCCTGIHGSDEHIVTGYFIPPTLPPTPNERIA